MKIGLTALDTGRIGISGAIQHTAAIGDADFVIAANKNENATMMRLADVAVVSSMK